MRPKFLYSFSKLDMFTVINEQSVWTHFEVVRTKLLLTTFTTFWYIFSKNANSHVLKCEKYVKYVLSNTGCHYCGSYRKGNNIFWTSPSLLSLMHYGNANTKITDHSFRYASPCLRNQLPLSLRQPHSSASCSISDSPIPSHHFFLFWFTTLLIQCIHNSLSLSLPV